MKSEREHRLFLLFPVFVGSPLEIVGNAEVEQRQAIIRLKKRIDENLLTIDENTRGPRSK